jgi:hypothetical protein
MILEWGENLGTQAGKVRVKRRSFVNLKSGPFYLEWKRSAKT